MSINGSNGDITTLEGTDWICRPTLRCDLRGYPPSMPLGTLNDIWPVGPGTKCQRLSATTGDRAILPQAEDKTP